MNMRIELNEWIKEHDLTDEALRDIMDLVQILGIEATLMMLIEGAV